MNKEKLKKIKYFHSFMMMIYGIILVSTYPTQPLVAKTYLGLIVFVFILTNYGFPFVEDTYKKTKELTTQSSNNK